MASDDDTIFVDVAARLDEKSADQTAGRLRDRFKNVGKSIGDAVGSELGQSVTHEIGDVLGSKLNDLGKEAGERLGKVIGGGVKDLASDIGVDLGGIADKITGSFEGIQKITGALGSLKQGDVSGGLAGIAKSLHDIAGESAASDVLGRIAQKGGQFNELKTNLKGVTELFSGFKRDAPGIEGAFGRIGDAAGRIIGPLGGVATLMKILEDPKINDDLGKIPGMGVLSDIMNAPGDFGQYLHDHLHLPTMPVDPRYQHGAPGGPKPTPFAPAAPPNPAAGGNFLPSLPGAIQGPGGMGSLPSIAPPDTGGFHTSGATTGGGIHATLVDYTTPDITSSSDIPSAGAGVANLYRVAQSLEGTPYSQQLRNDCSGMVSKLANAALGLPPIASFSTQNEGPWLSQHGFQPGMGGPGDLSIGWYNRGSDPNSGHTAATLPGGVNAESGGSHGAFALGSGAAGAGSPQFDQHMHLPMGSGGGFGARQAGFGIPGGGGGFGNLPGLGTYAPPTVGGKRPIRSGVSAPDGIRFGHERWRRRARVS